MIVGQRIVNIKDSWSCNDCFRNAQSGDDCKQENIQKVGYNALFIDAA